MRCFDKMCNNYHRTNDEITRIIINVLNNYNPKGLRPTKLMRKTNCSNVTLKRYINDLMDKGLIEMYNIKDNIYFKATEQGSDFLFNNKELIVCKV